MQQLLGLDTRGNFTATAHAGRALARRLFGYFPCYTLGAMYAAQWFAAMRRAMPDLDARIGRGELSAVFDWLRDHIWSAGLALDHARTGAPRQRRDALNPAHYRAHLRARYLG
jgi:carboxypeptidase Taq